MAGDGVPRPGIDSRPCLANARVYINADVDLKRETVLKNPVRFFDLPHQLAFNLVIVVTAGSRVKPLKIEMIIENICI